MTEPAVRSSSAGCLVLFYGLGIGLLLIAWFGAPFFLGDWSGLSDAFGSGVVRTTGTVVAVEGSSSGTSRFSTPVVEFEADGRTITFRAQGTNLANPGVGDRVPVAYRRDAPERAVIRTFSQTWMTPLLMTLFATPFLLIAIIGTVRLLRRRAL